MAITLEQFQEAVAERRKTRKHGARSYDEELVAFAVSYAHASGLSANRAAKMLGVSVQTLQSWQQRLADGVQGKLREVRVEDPVQHTSSTRLTLTMSSGHQVGGLDMTQLVELLRRLA